MQDILSKFEATIRRHGLLRQRGGAVLAVSGGPDSVALLHLMREARDRSYPRLALHVGHLHHGMRGAAADEDARFVEAESARLGLACTIERADVPELAAEHGWGIEVAGREARYQFLTRLAQSLGAGEIAFGHHADDQAETVLMRVLRGAGPRGMGGIPCAREIAGAPGIRVIRPLLDCSRREILRFLRARGLSWRLDSTNLSRSYLRNRLRRAAIPQMKREWGAGLTEDLCSLAGLAQRFQARAEAMRAALRAGQPVRVMDGYVETEVEWLRRLPAGMLADEVQAWMKEAGLWRKMLSAREYGRIADLVKRGSGRMALSGGALASVWRGMFMLSPAPDVPSAAQEELGWKMRLEVPGRTRIERLGGSLEAEVLSAGQELIGQKRATRDGFEEFLDLEKVDLPLTARFPRPGDRMRPLGAPGGRKLQDIFTDLHVPRWLRTRTLIVTMPARAERDRPIWIVGRRIADGVKLTERTRRVLRLRFLPKG